MTTKLLCATDFSAGSQRALDVAVQIATRTNATLVLAHVCYLPAIAFANEVMVSPTLIQEMVDDAQHGLDDAVRAATAALARPVTGTMMNGVPWAEIVGLLERGTFDLCVVGTRGRTGLPRVLLGSVAEMVVRRAPCPVLAVRPDTEARPFQHVLVPTDFSPSAAQALELAAKVVRSEGRVTLLHVLEFPAPYPGELAEDDLLDLERQADTALEEVAAGVKDNVRVTTMSRFGWPGEQILVALDEDPTIDLVALGSHGRTGIRRVLIGSVAEKTVRYARCPVLVVRQPTKPR